MWAYFEKKEDSLKKAVYAYGYESKETTGELEILKDIFSVTFNRKAHNEPEGIDNLFLKGWAYKLVKDNYPEKKTIAIG